MAVGRGSDRVHVHRSLRRIAQAATRKSIARTDCTCSIEVVLTRLQRIHRRPIEKSQPQSKAFSRTLPVATRSVRLASAVFILPSIDGFAESIWQQQSVACTADARISTQAPPRWARLPLPAPSRTDARFRVVTINSTAQGIRRVCSGAVSSRSSPQIRLRRQLRRPHTHRITRILTSWDPDQVAFPGRCGIDADRGGSVWSSACGCRSAAEEKEACERFLSRFKRKQAASQRKQKPFYFNLIRSMQRSVRGCLCSEIRDGIGAVSTLAASNDPPDPWDCSPDECTTVRRR